MGRAFAWNFSGGGYIDVFNRNSDRLKNANMIYEGQILVLPAKESS